MYDAEISVFLVIPQLQLKLSLVLTVNIYIYIYRSVPQYSNYNMNTTNTQGCDPYSIPLPEKPIVIARLNFILQELHEAR